MLTTRRRRGRAVGAAAAVALAIAASGSGTTYAAFSDFDDVADNEVGAARVSLGIPGAGTAPDLVFADLVPAVSRSESLAVSYLGTIRADIALELRPDGGSPFCDEAGDGSWHPGSGGQLQISTGSGWLDYCSLLDPGSSLPIEGGVAPGRQVTVDVSLRLAPGTDHRYRELSDVDELTVTAQQTGVAGGGFTDFAVGTISIDTGFISPAVPAECADLGPFDADNTFVLEPGADVFATPRTPGHGRGYLVFGLGGDDEITGSAQADCLVGGDGDDVLSGGNQHDVLVGGNGDDRLVGSEHANGKDRLHGGDGDDELHGGNGKDALSGGDGDDLLYGGPGTDSWGPGPGVDRCIDPGADPASFDPADYGDCESVSTDEAAVPLTVPAPLTVSSPVTLAAPKPGEPEAPQPLTPPLDEPEESTEPEQPPAEEPETTGPAPTEPPSDIVEPEPDEPEPTEPPPTGPTTPADEPTESSAG